MNIDKNSDLPDSPRDKKELKSETTYIDMPDVKDIPGQEFIHVPGVGELGDTTISSADEEGDEIWAEADEDISDDDLIMGNDGDVTAEEKNTLKTTSMDVPTLDNTNLRHAVVDSFDNEGDKLNESANAQSGRDLDTAMVDDDDAMEDIGEEDEENNTYSLGGDDQKGEDSTNG